MKVVGMGILFFEGIVFLTVIALLIYLVVRRIEDKKNETFEQRNN